MDYIKRHKKIIYKAEFVRLCNFGDSDDEIQGIIGPSAPVQRDDILCSNCISFYKKNFLAHK